MVEVKRVSRTRETPAEFVEGLIARDFPKAHVRIGRDLLELAENPEVRAVAVPAETLTDEPAAGLDHFAFPDAEEAAGLAVVFRAGDPMLRALRRFYLPPVVLAGAGPGGEGTMTVAAARAVAEADVVFTDVLCGSEVLRGRRPEARCVAVGKRCGKHSVKQTEINRMLAVESKKGRRVVRLKGGDPSVFGRLEEEIDTLRDLGLSYRVLPGVGAASGAAALLGQPLTVREIASEVIFSTGRLAGGGRNPFPLDGPAPTIALYMSRKVLAERMVDLAAAGFEPDTPVAVIEKIGSPQARSVIGTVETIAEIADREDVGTPAVVLVGRHLHAPDHLPLHGVRVWLPAEEETAQSHREKLEALGASCVLEPLIEPEPLPVDHQAIFARPFDWVLFTSKKSVDFFFAELHEWGFDSRWLPRVAAIGTPTIEKLRARGIEPDLIPPEPTRAALSSSLIGLGLEGKRVLIPASAVAPDQVRQTLAPHAGEVVRVDLYTIHYPEVRSVPPADVVLFSSETTVKSARHNGLLDAIRERGMLIGGIGPGTCGRLAREGLPPAIVPAGTGPASLARAVHRVFARLAVAAAGAPDA